MGVRNEIAVFNFERTIVHDPFYRAISDVNIPGLNSDDYHKHNEARNLERLLDWLSGKVEAEVEPLWDLTREQAWGRVAPFAKLLMAKEISLGHDICIYSATVLTPMLNAYADGLEAVDPRLRIEYLFGKVPILRDGQYTTEREQMLKTETLEQLEGEGHTIEFIADSYTTTIHALRKGRRRVMVNPEPRLFEIGDKEQIPIIYWKSDYPEVTQLKPSNAKQFDTYDLGYPPDHGPFLEDLGYVVKSINDR